MDNNWVKNFMQDYMQKEAQKRAAEQAKLAAEEVVKEAALRAFKCRRCPEAFPSNTKLHQHLRERHAKPPKSANQLSLSPIFAIDAPPNGLTVLTTIPFDSTSEKKPEK